MLKLYPEYKNLDLVKTGNEQLDAWEKDQTFLASMSKSKNEPSFVFYEGPPSANGKPGIHHLMARAIKDLFCRYKTQKGYIVQRKAGWDTHGLPIELAVEKSLGITKEDIGNKISIEEYNQACRKEVMKYTDQWEELTRRMGYWVDMKDPYITYENKYIESCWWLLNKIHGKNLLYKGYTIQPFSPAAGTGLSSHELNQPGCYKNVKDRTATVMFKTSITEPAISALLKNVTATQDIFFLAWTTTPWTLPSNTALAVGSEIDYVIVETFHPFAHQPVFLILARNLLHKYFPEKHAGLPFFEFKPGNKEIPYRVAAECKGRELVQVKYQQLLCFSKVTDGKSFQVVSGDFVTTSDGTGIVHIAPSFGADDYRVAKQNGIGALTLVDKRGKFLPEVRDDIFLYGGEFVKEAYLNEEEKKTEYQKQKKILESAGKIKNLKAYLSVDERIVLKLQEEGKLFKKENYEHSYPHCWRTDKPIIYYPLDSWFIKTSAEKEKMLALNATINWKPAATGTGRFGNWLENLNDWNLSRSRFWGIPIPVWTSEDGLEQIVVDSVATLKKEVERSVSKGFMKFNPFADFIEGDFSSENYEKFDLHKPFTDALVLERNGKKLFREPDLMDVWFDSGAMPYAQLHYPFENKELIDDRKLFPADFIAEGVDQTRGWFFTLHALSVIAFDSVAYKNVVSNGLVLDKNGNKMSKRLGNAVDPFATLDKFGPDATRWYLITNAAPWDNLKFDAEGISEIQRKFFGTLFNTYSFFALYANVDSFRYSEPEISLAERPEIDRWILSALHTLIKETDGAYQDYEPHRAGRAIEIFTDELLSNWYVRLCRRRFWKGEYSADKIAAYQTLYTCLETITRLAAPIAPFYMDHLFKDLNRVTRKIDVQSVHLSDFPVFNPEMIDKNLESRMEMAKTITSLILSIRKKENLKVRQPLTRVQIPVVDNSIKAQIQQVEDLILLEVNVKKLEFIDEQNSAIIKHLKLNFKTLGKKCGDLMKVLQKNAIERPDIIIRAIETAGHYTFSAEGREPILVLPEDVEIIPVDVPGWKVANLGGITVALDVSITELLRQEGLARELVNRIQNFRKEIGLDLTDRILVKIASHKGLDSAIINNLDYICSETLAKSLNIVEKTDPTQSRLVIVDEEIQTNIFIEKIKNE